jgi:uncharacterized protein (DUF2267 family)
MRYAQLIDRVVALAGLQQASEAERAVEATLPSLAELLAADDTEALRRGLPPQASRWLHLDTPPRPRAARGGEEVEAFYARVAERSGLEPGFAREQAQAVLAAVGEIGDAAAVSRVVRHLPRAFGALFTAPHEGLAASPGSSRTPGATSTLSSGRPGSQQPVSEARADTAHAHSVARSDDPHAETRLSSAHGLRQERLGDSLATGAPGSSRPIAGARR